MDLKTVTAKTKAAVRRWAGMVDDDALVLDVRLDTLRPGAGNALRVEINSEFTGAGRFPVSSPDWNTLSPTTVRNVRDECRKRAN